MQGHLFHVKLHFTSSICPWQHQVHRVIGKQEVGGRQRAICVMCSIKSAICATLLLCQMACSRVAKVWGLQRKSPGFRRAFNESFHAFGDIARKSFNVIHHERFKWKPSFSERFAKMFFCSIFFFTNMAFLSPKFANRRSTKALWILCSAVPERQPTSASVACSTFYGTFLELYFLTGEQAACVCFCY